MSTWPRLGSDPARAARHFAPGSRWLIVLLGLLGALAPLSMDIYLVSMPSLGEVFATDVSRVQLTLSVYMAGFAVGQIFYGPASDRFGRRIVLMAGLALFIVAVIGAALAPSVEALIAARFFQALGMSAAPILGRAIVRDMFERELAARTLSYIAVVHGVAPILAPIIGSHLHVAVGWQGGFVFVAIYAALALWFVTMRLAETLKQPDPDALDPARMARTFSSLLANRQFVGAMLICCFTGAGLFAYIASAAYVYIGVFGFPESQFGYLFATVMLGNIAGSILGGKLVMRLGIMRMMRLGTSLALVAGLALAWFAWAGSTHVASVIAPMMAYMIAFSLILPSATAAALGPFPANAGAASALLGFFQLLVSATVGTLAGALFDSSAVPMASAVGLMAFLAFASYAIMARRRESKEGDA